MKFDGGECACPSAEQCRMPVPPEEVYLVWSNEHRGWWKHGGYGYSALLSNAGRYTRDQALDICRNAIPTAMHVGMVAEIPVRLIDVKEFLAGQIVPRAITGKALDSFD